MTDDASVPGPPSAERLRLATVELLGALAYGQLRSFQVTASAVSAAPDARRADRVATFAIREYQAYTVLRDHLIDETDLAAGVIDRQRDVFDAYFNAIPLDDWRSACAYFAVGLPIAADFGREIAPTLSEQTAEVVVSALADREEFEEWALEELQSQMATPEEVEQVRRVVADMLGRALTGYQGAMAETDALQVLLLGADGSGEAGAALVRRVALHVLENHRRRMHALGIDDLS